MEKMTNSASFVPPNEVFFLPPNVYGKTKAILYLSIDKIFWRTSKVFNDVKIVVKWWGDKNGNTIEGIKTVDNRKSITNQNSLKTVQYQVRTNEKLFQSYLANCEAIVFDIYSMKTKDLIGTAKCEIPIKFLNTREGLEQTFKKTTKIFSSRQFNLGDLEITVLFTPLEMTQKISTTSVDKKDASVTMKNNKNRSKKKYSSDGKCSNKENIEIVGVRKTLSTRDPIPSKPSLTRVKKVPSISSLSSLTSEQGNPLLINYLSGVKMSQVDQKNSLHDLKFESPTKQTIQSLRTFPEQTETIKHLNITLSKIEINATGQMQIQRFMNGIAPEKCILKCVASSKNFMRSDQDAKWISPVFESTPNKLTLGKKQITQQIRISSDGEQMYVNFGFCLKTINNFQAPAVFLGYSKINLSDILLEDEVFHKKCPIFNERDQKIGSVNANIAFESKRRPPQSTQSHPIPQQKRVTFAHQTVQTISCPSSASNSCQTEHTQQDKTIQTERKSEKTRNQQNSHTEESRRDTEMIEVDKTNQQQTKPKVYSGLLFIENLRNVKQSLANEFFITYVSFWNDCPESTNSAVDFVFNYMKLFPVICENDFLQRVQNSHLELKLWERNGGSEKWIASTKIPLHHFYAAFRDTAMIEHLSVNRLPIISIDTYANFISPLSSELFCQGKVLLAIGTENQIEYLKITRKLYDLQAPIVETQTRKVQEPAKSDPNEEMKNRLKAFIDSFSQTLPTSYGNDKKIPIAPLPLPTQPKLRKTSELLDTLQKALQQPAPANFQLPERNVVKSKQPEQPQIEPESESQNSNSSLVDRVGMLVTIEHASHIPMVIMKKKHNHKHRNRSSNSTQHKNEFEPSTYVTFESALIVANENRLPERVVKSHEGFVHCTKLVKGCDPQWDENFDIQIPLDMITNKQKRFVVKVWRKSHENSEMLQTPFTDPVVGFSAVDLSVLLTGLPLLSGYYNIMDFSGRCHGQIKLSFRPKENLANLADSSISLSPPIMRPLSIDCSSDEGSTVLSRTLKRKFTELEEITQRLKARLFDVTGDDNFDPDEEFENDLNTEVDENEDDDMPKEDFAWLRDRQAFLDNILDPQPSTSRDVPSTPRQITGQSSEAPSQNNMGLDELLKKYDLDTIINPNIFQNILDPALANSDSTPTLQPVKATTQNDDYHSADSCDTTVSSILSVDHLQIIQKALQKTSIDGSNSNSLRKDPDGEHLDSE